MAVAGMVLDVVLAALLALTLAFGLRMRRALDGIRADRAALETSVAGFAAGTSDAEASVAKLRDAAEGAGRAVAQRAEAGRRVADDLALLIERGERLADRLEAAVRAARPLAAAEPQSAARAAAREPAVRSQAERDLMRALQLVR